MHSCLPSPQATARLTVLSKPTRHFSTRTRCTQQKCAEEVAQRYGWTFDSAPKGRRIRGGTVQELPIQSIRRPLGKTRENDQEKVAALMTSITEIGLREPIDVLEVDGRYYGFSGCHRFEAHVRLGKETILCRVRKATQQSLEAHMK